MIGLVSQGSQTKRFAERVGPPHAGMEAIMTVCSRVIRTRTPREGRSQRHGHVVLAHANPLVAPRAPRAGGSHASADFGEIGYRHTPSGFCCSAVAIRLMSPKT